MRTLMVRCFSVSVSAVIGEVSRSGAAVSLVARSGVTLCALEMTDAKPNDNAPYFRNPRRDTSWTGVVVRLPKPAAPADARVYHFRSWRGSARLLRSAGPSGHTTPSMTIQPSPDVRVRPFVRGDSTNEH